MNVKSKTQALSSLRNISMVKEKKTHIDLLKFFN